ncbi:MAG: hypothetical protein HC889_07990 [Synechococcaceae cyanobacterium SM1_2_3]|nr:hypothetical protein [Synechococcaceae cyanobacterium SM1_2_3]
MIGLLFDPAAESSIQADILPLLGDRPAQVAPYRRSALPDWPEGMIVLIFLSDDQFTELASDAVARQWRIGLLPHPAASQARRCFGVAQRLEHALDDALNDAKDWRFDLLCANNRLVFNSVVIGDMFPLSNSGQSSLFHTRLVRFLNILRSGFGILRLQPCTLTTGKDRSLATAALGIVIVRESRGSLLFKRVVDDSGNNDGMLHAMILAPRSRMEMLRFLLGTLFLGSQRTKLPPFVGHIKTAALNVTSSRPLDYCQDGIWISARQLELTIAPKALRLLPGRYLELRPETSQTREIYRVNGLPFGESRTALASQPLPWLHRASTEDFKDLYQSLRDNARSSSAYLTLMVLSTLLATLGLFANSAPVESSGP